MDFSGFDPPGQPLHQGGMRRGSLVAKALHCVWRKQQAAPDLSLKDLTEILPLLLNSGCGALGWWHIRHSDLRESPPGLGLREVYRSFALKTSLIELRLGKPFSMLQTNGVTPLLGKGWAVARLYPEPGLRPYGDLDLYVRREDYARSLASIGLPGDRGFPVDLHDGFAELDDRSLDELYARSRSVNIGGVAARIFGPEDHLRLLCLHLLREGALRPLWLCDVGAAIENLPADFDWNYLLSGDRRRTEWMICAIGLAHHLLGARIDATPIAGEAKQLPHWMVPTVLQQWGVGRITNGSRLPMRKYLRHPAGAISALRLRWPNSIEATVGLKGPFNEWPRLPFQIGECLRRTASFARQLPKIWREAQ